MTMSLPICTMSRDVCVERQTFDQYRSRTSGTCEVIIDTQRSTRGGADAKQMGFDFGFGTERCQDQFRLDSLAPPWVAKHPLKWRRKKTVIVRNLPDTVQVLNCRNRESCQKVGFVSCLLNATIVHRTRSVLFCSYCTQ